MPNQTPATTPLAAAAAAPLPLAGVRVIEFSQIASGPFCGILLGDFG